MVDVNGNVVSTQPLVYRPNTTVDLLYPGTTVNPDGSIDDVPGWILTDDGLWIRDPSDEFLRDGIRPDVHREPHGHGVRHVPARVSHLRQPGWSVRPTASPPSTHSLVTDWSLAPLDPGRLPTEAGLSV